MRTHRRDACATRTRNAVFWSGLLWITLDCSGSQRLSGRLAFVGQNGLVRGRKKFHFPDSFGQVRIGSDRFGWFGVASGFVDGADPCVFLSPDAPWIADL